jgi:tRNA(fMet)-specific endonuclease VapC
VTWLPDTDACIAYLNGTSPSLRDRLLAAGPARIVLCSVVKAELLYGAHHSARVDTNLERLEAFFAPFTSVPFDDDAAHRYGLLRETLAARGTPIGANDLLIASIALARGLVVITRNAREYRRVPGLPVETW